MPNRAVISVAGSCMSAELVDVLWGTGMVFPTDDDELPEVTGPAWIVDNVAHYGG
ncbi:hypothetical protein BANRA_05465 [Escherichia coli]|uniref:Uncharacterized protein n=1 Tax=Escherichia coli TaxID=562 RepID=A0A3P5HBS1_ECOLX|nr:hypothetical protein BANRA_05465 [Escherichia coli]